MGNEGSNLTDPSAQRISERYDILRSFTDSRLGPMTVLSDRKTGEIMGLKEFRANSNEEIEALNSSFNQRNKLDHPNIARPREILFKKEDALCGTFHKIQLLFEYHENDLMKDIERRQSTDDYFSEDQLWFIAESIIQSMAYLQ